MRILLATDGSDDAAAALDFMLRFPLPADCSVILLTVIDERAFVDARTVELSEAQNQVLHEARNTVREEAQGFLDAAAEAIAQRVTAVDKQLRSGDIAEEIVVAAERARVDLIVVGSHGRAPVRHFLLGSVSTKVLDYAPCSVLIVRQPEPGQPLPGGDGQPWRLLLAYDDSAPARRAVELCAGLPFGDEDEMEVVTALTLVTGFRQDIRQQMSPIWQQKKIAARAALEGAVARLHATFPAVRSQLREGASSAQEILAAARAAGSNLIVLGCTGKSPMQRLLVGSLTRQVAHHAPCSVLAVRDD